MADRDPYDIRWHGHRLDPYRLFVLYDVRHPALQQAIKKVLCAGRRRGGKDAAQDVEEAIEALRRWQQMDGEDQLAEIDAEEVATEPPAGPPRKLVRVEPQPDERGWITLATGEQAPRPPHPRAVYERIDGIWYWVIPQDEEGTKCSP